MQLYEENITLQEALIRESKGPNIPATIRKEIPGIKIPVFLPNTAAVESSKKKEEAKAVASETKPIPEEGATQ